ncbi:pyridoxamine 5-phosphate oxidase [Rhodobacter capsulatus]|uniref:Pyridoxamine 5-phosphate oxidase n=1 Tax=Rhodobacter capsulatus TaxID=1061 RepID=A0A4U1JLD1_RHOCA|nr:pyridoxamine 5'-phosphate oxidase family protein [Rhodobacter capsulatus]TKD13849.1 pyridoxamine 5-phosphate oxidase [Rhodobacter capsulatus]
MSENRKDPVQPADAEARHLARGLITAARFGALGVIDPETGFPFVSRIALGATPEGGLCTLVSGLSAHSRALRADPRVSLLVGEPGPKGDPLAHPRLTLLAMAAALPRTAALCDRWLSDHPKAKLYIDLPDFFFVGFSLRAGALNGGFGRAFRLAPADLT